MWIIIRSLASVRIAAALVPFLLHALQPWLAIGLAALRSRHCHGTLHARRVQTMGSRSHQRSRGCGCKDDPVERCSVKRAVAGHCTEACRGAVAGPVRHEPDTLLREFARFVAETAFTTRPRFDSTTGISTLEDRSGILHYVAQLTQVGACLLCCFVVVVCCCRCFGGLVSRQFPLS